MSSGGSNGAARRLQSELPVLTSAAPGGTETYIPRFADTRLEQALARSAAVELRGPRGVGKTTTALQMARSVLALQNPDTAAAVSEDPRSALLGQPAPLLIDEWQEVPEVLWAVKEHLDTSNRPGQFVITGSVRSDSWQQMPLTGTLRSDRHVSVQPLRETRTVRETRAQCQAVAREACWRVSSWKRVNSTSASTTTSISQCRAVTRTRWRRSIPEARAARLRNRIDGTVNVDILVGRHDRSKLADFMTCYALHSGGVVPIQRLCDDAGVSRNTGYAYLRLLARTYLVADAPSFHHNRISHLRRSPKRLLVDAGLLAASWDADVALIRCSADLRGRLLETFTAAQLRAQALASDVRYRLAHLRRNDREIDFVLDAGVRGIVAVEVKAGVRGGRKEARHLFWLREQIGNAFAGGAVLHTGKRPPHLLDNSTSGRIWSAPISALWA